MTWIWWRHIYIVSHNMNQTSSVSGTVKYGVEQKAFNLNASKKLTHGHRWYKIQRPKCMVVVEILYSDCIGYDSAQICGNKFEIAIQTCEG